MSITYPSFTSTTHLGCFVSQTIEVTITGAHIEHVELTGPRDDEDDQQRVKMGKNWPGV